MMPGIADLDELILSCRNDRARSYIAEAVNCYRAGSYRSAIIATWIAVVYDIIEKLRELAIGGDTNAIRQVERFEKNVETRNVQASQSFERDILTIAAKEFELISNLEFENLEALQKSRNRCAHPTMQSIADAYQPTPEEARYLLRIAVSYLLSQAPVQGKAALSVVTGMIESLTFPTDAHDAQIRLAKSPLERARPALVRRVTRVHLEKLLEDSVDDALEAQRLAALLAISRMYPEIFEDVLFNSFGALVARLSDDSLWRVFRLFTAFPRLWMGLDLGLQHRTLQYVKICPDDTLPTIFVDALTFDPLREATMVRVHSASPELLAQLIERDTNPLLTNDAIKHFSASKSFAQARDRLAVLVRPLSQQFQSHQISSILTAYASNNQILYCNGMEQFISNLLEAYPQFHDQNRESWFQVYERLKYENDKPHKALRNTIAAVIGFKNDEPYCTADDDF